MLKATKKLDNQKLFVEISGSMDEGLDFDALIGQVPAEIHLMCSKVTRINSTGVKAWLRYVQKLRSEEKKIKLVQCSAAVVEQLNLFSNFAFADEVESICVPYMCGTCKKELTAIFSVGDIRKQNLKPPVFPCTNCNGTAEFDELPSYFKFLGNG